MRTENQNCNLGEIYVPYLFNTFSVISIIIDVYKYCLKLMYLPVGCLFTVHGNWPSMVHPEDSKSLSLSTVSF